MHKPLCAIKCSSISSCTYLKYFFRQASNWSPVAGQLALCSWGGGPKIIVKAQHCPLSPPPQTELEHLWPRNSSLCLRSRLKHPISRCICKSSKSSSETWILLSHPRDSHRGGSAQQHQDPAPLLRFSRSSYRGTEAPLRCLILLPKDNHPDDCRN